MYINKEIIHQGRRIKCHICGQSHIGKGDRYLLSWTGGWGYHSFAYSCLRKLVIKPDPTLSFGIEPVR